MAGAVIEGPEGVLLVANRRRGGAVDWSTPGWVIDEGEDIRAGLAREVLEETGLAVTAWGELLYGIEVHAPDLGWDLRVEVHRAAAVRGDVSVGDDPDGIVIGSTWAASGECERLLGDAHPWVREPLVDWLRERWAAPRRYRYRIDGTSIEDFRVTRTS